MNQEESIKVLIVLVSTWPKTTTFLLNLPVKYVLQETNVEKIHLDNVIIGPLSGESVHHKQLRKPLKT